MEGDEREQKGRLTAAEINVLIYSKLQTLFCFKKKSYLGRKRGQKVRYRGSAINSYKISILKNPVGEKQPSPTI